MFESYQLRQDWSQDLPRYWCDNSPFKTHFLNAMSATFPNGEQFFIDAIKQYKDKITDPQLLAEVNEFIKQEVWHSYAHKQYNIWLEKQGLPADHVTRVNGALLRWVKRTFSSRACLAITVGLEHITALTGAHSLRYRSFLKSMHPHFEQIWRWHSVEEIEHKSVSIDVWNAVEGNQTTRRVTMLFATIVFAWSIMYGTIAMLYTDKQLWKWRNIKDAWFMLFAPQGIIRETFIPWLHFMRRDFHPTDHDNTILLKFSKE